MTQLAEHNTIHLKNKSRFQALSLKSDPAWLDELRKSALGHFETTGFPDSRAEDWRFTNIQPIVRTPFKLAEAADDHRAAELARTFSFGDGACCELVFVDGHFSPALSAIHHDVAGLTVKSLRDALLTETAKLERSLGRFADIEKNPFVALNTGFIHDGALIHLSRGATCRGPVHLLFVSTESSEPTVSHPRVIVLAEDNAEAQLVESFVGTKGAYFTNAVTEIVLGRDCRIDHCKLQQESVDAYHVATMQVELGRNSTFVSHSLTLGGKLTRNDLNCTMAGEGAYATLNGLALLNGTQHCDNHTLLDHAKPNCPSHELYKHVLRDKATGVFKGKILVRKDAQKTDSKQTSKSLLLSDDATMNSQPALEIYADDVKCTHGSTTGPVDEEMVFYLRSRGVGLDAARHLLTYAFAADITRRIKVEPVRRRVEDYMAAQHGLPQDLRITHLGAHDDAVAN